VEGVCIRYKVGKEGEMRKETKKALKNSGEILCIIIIIVMAIMSLKDLDVCIEKQLEINRFVEKVKK